MDIYISRLSQPSRSVLLLCSVSGVEHSVHEVDLRKGEHKTADYLANVNPCGFVPALREGDFRLAESGAILSYICDSNELETLYPTVWPPPRALCYIAQNLPLAIGMWLTLVDRRMPKPVPT